MASDCMETKFVLHVGMSKTATTTMQEGLFSLHPDIAYIGKSIKRKTSKQCTSEAIYEAFAPALWLHDRRFDSSLATEVGRSLLGCGVSQKKILLGSWEEFGSLPDPERFSEILRRLKRSFKPCKVLFVLRNPITWAPSEYLQRLRWNFLRACERPIGYRTYIDFDAWWDNVEDYAKGGGLFSYGPNIQRAVDVVGADNVAVLMYEELISDVDSFCAKLTEFLDIDGQGVRDLLQSTHRNSRMTGPQLQLLKDINNSPVRKFVWRFSPVFLRRRQFRLANKVSMGSSGPAKFSLDALQIARVSEKTKDMNAWIREKFGTPLEKYGYPL